MYDAVFSNFHQKGLLKLTFQRVTGRGRILPRLEIQLRAQALSEAGWVFAPDLPVNLAFAGEVICTGRMSLINPIQAKPGFERDFIIPLPISREALDFINMNVSGSKIDLTMEFDGVFYTCAADSAGNTPRFPQADWQSQDAGRNSQLRFQVARSVWYSDVVQPIGTDEFVFAEVRLPKEDTTGELHSAYTNLSAAEKAFFLGDDPATFLHLRAAIDALPGAKKQIFSHISDELKREKLDDTALAIGSFLHSGRHVADQGEARGLFPVDHRDAGFALALVKLLIAYLSQTRSSG